MKKANRQVEALFVALFLFPLIIGFYQNCQKVTFETAEPQITETPPFQSELSSESPSLKLEPAILTFDSQLLNNTSQAKSIRLTNPSDHDIEIQDLHFSSIGQDSSSNQQTLGEEFLLNQADSVGGCFQGMTLNRSGFVLGAGSSCTFQFRFRPKTVGLRQLQISVLTGNQTQLTALLKGAGYSVAPSSTTSTTSTSTTFTTTSTTTTTMVSVTPARCGPATSLVHSSLPETGLCDVGQPTAVTYQSTDTRSVNWKCVVTGGSNETNCSAEAAPYRRFEMWMGNGWRCEGSGIGPNIAGELQFESHGGGLGCGRAVFRIRIDGTLQMQSSSCGPC
jgi:hypothetical protein